MNPLKRLALEVLLCKRPAGGPYRVVVHDGPRWLTPNEYYQFIYLHESPEGEEESRLWKGVYSASDIAAVLAGTA